MKIFAKSLLIQTAKKYTNYIAQVVAYPPTRIKVDSYADDYSKVYVSNVTAQMGYLRFYFDMEKYSLNCTSEYIRTLSEESAYWQIATNPTLVNMEIGNTYEIPCSIQDKNTGNTVQEFTIYYTRTI